MAWLPSNVISLPCSDDATYISGPFGRIGEISSFFPANDEVYLILSQNHFVVACGSQCSSFASDLLLLMAQLLKFVDSAGVIIRVQTSLGAKHRRAGEEQFVEVENSIQNGGGSTCFAR